MGTGGSFGTRTIPGTTPGDVRDRLRSPLHRTKTFWQWYRSSLNSTEVWGLWFSSRWFEERRELQSHLQGNMYRESNAIIVRERSHRSQKSKDFKRRELADYTSSLRQARGRKGLELQLEPAPGGSALPGPPARKESTTNANSRAHEVKGKIIL